MTGAGRETRLERAYRQLGERLGDRLAEELLRAPTLEPKLTPALAAAYAIAVTVHAAVLAVLVGGVLLAVTNPNPFTVALGLLAVGLAFLMRPRFGSLPEGAVSADRAPQLHATISEIAAAMQTRPPDVIAVDHEFNAYWTVAGLRRRRVLGLGLPLLAAMDPAARAALIAHELGHARNGDSRRGIVIGTAVDALQTFHEMLMHNADEDIRGEEWAGTQAFTMLVSRAVAAPVRWLLVLEHHLLLRDSQRAEYLADARAASVVGTRAVVDSTAVLLLEPDYRTVLHRRAVTGADPEGLLKEIAAKLGDVDAAEKERRREAARHEKAKLDSTHPPVGKLIELIERRPVEAARVWSDSARARRVDTELAPLVPRIERDMLDAYRGTLYTG